MNTRAHSVDPAAARLVERRLRSSDLAAHQHPVERPTEPAVKPFVTISRMVGSRGTDLAHLLGKRLGWPVFDKEILTAMAEDDSTRERLYASVDERDPGWTEQTLRALMETGYARNDYFHRLTRTVVALARQRASIFVGRGADLILPRTPGLRLRIVAPEANCLEDFAHRYQLAAERARVERERVEGERSTFVRRHFHRGPEDASRFDLTINLGTFSLEEAADLVVGVMRERRLIEENQH